MWPLQQTISRICEILSISTVLVVSSFFYIYDVFYIVPTILDPIGQKIFALVCTWIMYKIVSNTWACSVIENTMDTLEDEAHLRRPCEICEMLEPPRSWHCKNCNRGMLMLEQNYNSTSSCIGYYKHRYFLWLTFFMSLGTGLVLVFNTIDLLRNFGNGSYESLQKNIVFGINLFSFLVPTLHFFHPDVGGYRKLNLLGQFWQDL